MQAVRRRTSWRSRQQDFLGPSRACRCSSSCLSFFWHQSPGLLYSVLRSNYQRCLLHPRRTPAPPSQASKWQTFCKSYSCGVHLRSPTFSKKPSTPSSNDGTDLQLLQTLTRARFSRSSLSCTIGPIVLANCLRRSCTLHSRANNHADTVWGSRNLAVES